MAKPHLDLTLDNFNGHQKAYKNFNYCNRVPNASCGRYSYNLRPILLLLFLLLLNLKINTHPKSLL